MTAIPAPQFSPTTVLNSQKTGKNSSTEITAITASCHPFMVPTLAGTRGTHFKMAYFPTMKIKKKDTSGIQLCFTKASHPRNKKDTSSATLNKPVARGVGYDFPRHLEQITGFHVPDQNFAQVVIRGSLHVGQICIKPNRS